LSTAQLVESKAIARPWPTSRVVVRPSARDRPHPPVVAAAAAIALLPLLRPGGPANAAPVDALIGFAIAASIFWGVSSGQRWRFPYVFPMFLFLAGGAVGAAAGSHATAGVEALAQDLVLVAWCWAIVNVSTAPGNLRVILGTWAYSSVVWAVLLFVGLATSTSALTGRATKDASRTMLTFGDPNVFANYCFISIMVVWASGRPRRWPLRVGAYAVLAAALATTGSNSGIISLAVGVIVAALLGVYQRSGAVPAATMLAFVALGAYFVLANVDVTKLQEKAQASRYAFVRDGIGREQTSVAQRTSILHETIQLYRTGGPLGAGPGSTKARLEAEQAPFVKEAHDDYLATLTERGVLGLLGLAFLLVSIAFRSLRGATNPLASFSSAIVRPNAIAGAIAGTFAAMAVLELLHARQVWTLFAIAAVLSLWGRECPESEPS